MPAWWLKASAQRAISLLPYRHWWNEQFQLYFTKSMALSSSSFEQRVVACERHLQHYAKCTQGSPSGLRILEIGTGWHPIIPLGLYLAGAREIWTYDVAPLLRLEQIQTTVDWYLRYAETGTLFKLLPSLRADRLEQLRAQKFPAGQKAPALLQPLGIRVVLDSKAIDELPADSIDLLVSYVVLEYLTVEQLRRLFRDYRRLGGDHCVMSHFVDMQDQFAYFDQRLSPINFLRFSEMVWRCIRSPLLPLNRLRLSDYVAILADCGYQTTTEVTRTAGFEAISRIPLAAVYRKYDTDDLLALTAWLFASRRREATSPSEAG